MRSDEWLPDMALVWFARINGARRVSDPEYLLTLRHLM